LTQTVSPSYAVQPALPPASIRFVTRLVATSTPTIPSLPRPTQTFPPPGDGRLRPDPALLEEGLTPEELQKSLEVASRAMTGALERLARMDR
jgi:hypothetical protein